MVALHVRVLLVNGCPDVLPHYSPSDAGADSEPHQGRQNTSWTDANSGFLSTTSRRRPSPSGIRAVPDCFLLGKRSNWSAHIRVVLPAEGTATVLASAATLIAQGLGALAG